MDIHQNARLTPRGREALAKTVVLQGVTLNSAAAEFKVSARTVAKWVQRYQSEGAAGLHDRSSRPRRSPRATAPALASRVIELRQQQRPAYHIACATAGPSCQWSGFCSKITGVHTGRLSKTAGTGAQVFGGFFYFLPPFFCFRFKTFQVFLYGIANGIKIYFFSLHFQFF